MIYHLISYITWYNISLDIIYHLISYITWYPIPLDIIYHLISYINNWPFSSWHWYWCINITSHMIHQDPWFTVDTDPYNAHELTTFTSIQLHEFIPTTVPSFFIVVHISMPLFSRTVCRSFPVEERWTRSYGALTMQASVPDFCSYIDYNCACWLCETRSDTQAARSVGQCALS